MGKNCPSLGSEDLEEDIECVVTKINRVIPCWILVNTRLRVQNYQNKTPTYRSMVNDITS
jgi:hypothetical protein